MSVLPSAPLAVAGSPGGAGSRIFGGARQAHRALERVDETLAQRREQGERRDPGTMAALLAEELDKSEEEIRSTSSDDPASANAVPDACQRSDVCLQHLSTRAATAAGRSPRSRWRMWLLGCYLGPHPAVRRRRSSSAARSPRAPSAGGRGWVETRTKARIEGHGIPTTGTVERVSASHARAGSCWANCWSCAHRSALVRQQARLHGGDVTVSTSPEGGARFCA